MAQELGVTFVGMMHLNATTDETLGRRLEGVARAILKLTRPDPNQPTRRKLEIIGNFKEVPPLGVTLHDKGCDYDSEPPESRPASKGGRPGNERTSVRDWIASQLTETNDQVGNEMQELAEKELGVSRKTFWRAVNDMEEEGSLVKDGKPYHLHLYGQNPEAS